jgi:hypothetical protein
MFQKYFIILIYLYDVISTQKFTSLILSRLGVFLKIILNKQNYNNDDI